MKHFGVVIWNLPRFSMGVRRGLIGVEAVALMFSCESWRLGVGVAVFTSEPRRKGSWYKGSQDC